MIIRIKAILFSLTFLGMCSLHLSGQKISLKDVELNLSLQDYRLEDIIDGTPDEDHIGYVYSGLVSSNLKQVYFDDSITEEFESLFNPVFSKSDEAIPLVIRINSIQINEWAEVYSKKSNLVSLSLSIFEQIGEDKYILVADRMINDISNEGVDINQLPNRIGRTADRAFDYLELTVGNNRPPLTWSQLWEYQPYQGLPYPRLKDDLQVYEHYSDFRQNKTLDDPSITLSQKSTGAALLVDGHTHPTSVWGYSLQGMLYVNIGKQFAPVERTDEGFAVALSSDEKASVLDSDGINRVNKLLGILSMHSDQKKYELPLSSSTGYLDLKSTYDLADIKDRTVLGQKTIVEFAPFGGSEGILDIKVDDQLLIQLSKGEFFEVPEQFRIPEIQACVSGHCESIILSDAPMHRIIFKKDKLSQESFTEKERMRYLRNVELKYWVMF